MSFERPTVAEDWEKFAKMVLPEDARVDQCHAMRKAFYAGAFVMLCDLVGGLDLTQPMSVAHRQYCARLQKELLLFNRTVAKEEGISSPDYLEDQL